jgi:hypothetical protein
MSTPTFAEVEKLKADAHASWMGAEDIDSARRASAAWAAYENARLALGKATT